jgi:hypothetical protein
VNVAEVMYTSPVVPREPSGLKTGLVHLRASFFVFYEKYVHPIRIRFDPVSRGAISGGLSKGRITFFRSAEEGFGVNLFSQASAFLKTVFRTARCGLEAQLTGSSKGSKVLDFRPPPPSRVGCCGAYLQWSGFLLSDWRVIT